MIVCTTKPDKYDWYLADAFIRQAIGQGSEAKGQDEAHHPSPITSHPEGFAFLNNSLLAVGHAIRYDGGAKEQ